MKRLITLCAATLVCVTGISASGFHAVKSGSRCSLGVGGLSGPLSLPKKGAQPLFPGVSRATLPGSVVKVLNSGKKAAPAISELKPGLYGWLTYSAACQLRMGAD